MEMRQIDNSDILLEPNRRKFVKLVCNNFQSVEPQVNERYKQLETYYIHFPRLYSVESIISVIFDVYMTSGMRKPLHLLDRAESYTYISLDYKIILDKACKIRTLCNLSQQISAIKNDVDIKFAIEWQSINFNDYLVDISAIAFYLLSFLSRPALNRNNSHCMTAAIIFTSNALASKWFYRRIKPLISQTDISRITNKSIYTIRDYYKYLKTNVIEECSQEDYERYIHENSKS